MMAAPVFAQRTIVWLLGVGGPMTHGLSAAYGATLMGGGR